MTAGDLLKQARKQIKHGEWMSWLEQHCKISDWTAGLYVQLAGHVAVVVRADQRHALDIERLAVLCPELKYILHLLEFRRIIKDLRERDGRRLPSRFLAKKPLDSGLLIVRCRLAAAHKSAAIGQLGMNPDSVPFCERCKLLPRSPAPVLPRPL